MINILLVRTAAVLFVVTVAVGARAENKLQAQTRTERDSIAQKTLLDLEFMFEGKGMTAPPGLPPYRLDSAVGRRTVRTLKSKLEDEFGLIVENDVVVGYHDEEYKKHHVGVVGCAVCHAGRAAGQFIPGLGNKTIDIFKLARAAQDTNPATPYWPDSVNRELHENAMHFINEIGNPKYATKTRGLIPIGLIRKWFFDIAGEKMDSDIPGSVKVPALWSYSEKKKLGSFSDGFGKGTLPGWAIAVELVGGQDPANVHKYLPKIEAAENALADLLPPKYPFAIDQLKASRGEVKFKVTCSGCHGTYERDAEGLPIFKQPLFIPLEVVGTDPARADGVTSRFRELVKSNPLNDIIQATELGRGYLAQRLDGVWARFPYLHNGSVPSIYALLNPMKRPAKFSVWRAGERERFDETAMGLNDAPLSSDARSVYDTSLFEHSNAGHDFASLKALSDTERFEIIEYLKTL